MQLKTKETQWKVIPEFSQYEASDQGSIRCVDTQRILTPFQRFGGYLTVTLKISEGETKLTRTRSVHRLVASAWIPNPDCKPTVDHLNRCRDDNAVVNLGWATFQEQASNRAERHTWTVQDRLYRICQYNVVTKRLIAEHKSMRAASIAVLGNESGLRNISCNVRGKSKSAYGFLWKYTEIIDAENEKWVHLSRNHQVSNMGRLRNKFRLFRCKPDNNGYPAVSIKLDDGSQLVTALHVIVARHFVKNDYNFPIVNHIDGNKMNAKASNLEWCTYAANTSHAVRTGLRKRQHKVIKIDTQGRQVGETYPSCQAAARAFDVNPSSVNKVCKGITHTCGENKLRFRFVDAEEIRERPPTRQLANRSNAALKVSVILRTTNQAVQNCNSVEAAARWSQCASQTVSAHCRREVRYPRGKYTFRFV